MKTVCIVPIKSISKRVKSKNFRIIGTKPLYRLLLDKLKDANFDKIYIDSDSEEIESYAKNNNFEFIYRDPLLSQDSANGNDLLIHHQKLINADLYFQIFVTAPLLKIETINNCINKLKNDHTIDSVLTAKSLYTWCWFDGKPVNYDTKILPRSQDAKPIIVETTGLYGIRKDVLKKNRSRIGNNPYFYEVSDEESIDLDNEEDFKLLEYYVSKNNLN
tara:strand:- start:279 stop:932 length:654 start_codon:yes stop_codon:yes gene_type:complete